MKIHCITKKRLIDAGRFYRIDQEPNMIFSKIALGMFSPILNFITETLNKIGMAGSSEAFQSANSFKTNLIRRNFSGDQRLGSFLIEERNYPDTNIHVCMAVDFENDTFRFRMLNVKNTCLSNFEMASENDVYHSTDLYFCKEDSVRSNPITLEDDMYNFDIEFDIGRLRDIYYDSRMKFNAMIDALSLLCTSRISSSESYLTSLTLGTIDNNLEKAAYLQYNRGVEKLQDLRYE